MATDQRICVDDGVYAHDPSPDTAAGPASFAAFDGESEGAYAPAENHDADSASDGTMIRIRR